MNVLIYRPAFERVRDRLDGRCKVLVMETDGQITSDGGPVSAPSIDAAWSNSDLYGTPLAAPFLDRLTSQGVVQWVQSSSAGTESPAFRKLLENGARLTTSHGQSVGVSEYVVSQVMDIFQNGPDRRAAQRDQVWRKSPAREIHGSRWLVVGFGAIGQAVAQRVRGFGAQVVGVRRAAGDHPLAERIVALSDFQAELPDADVVVLSIATSSATRALADAAFFVRMAPNAVLVNVGRGALVDEPALLASLDAGRPGHAVLDVFETEPLPAGHTFWTHPRVTVTAHTSALSSGQLGRETTSSSTT